jgi:hypothetical protein
MTYEKGQWRKHVFEGVPTVHDIHEKDDAIKDPGDDGRPNRPFECRRDGKVEYHYQKHLQRAASV